MFKENSKETTNMVAEALSQIEMMFKQNQGNSSQKRIDKSSKSSSANEQNAHRGQSWLSYQFQNLDGDQLANQSKSANQTLQYYQNEDLNSVCSHPQVSLTDMLRNKLEAQDLVVNTDQIVEVIQQQVGPDILKSDDSESQSLLKPYFSSILL